VNRPDALQRAGLYAPPPGASDLPGLEGAGIVDAAGPGFDGWLGQEVCALLPGGGYAEQALVPAAHCLPVPKGLSLREAAAVPETFFTVWSNVFLRGRLLEGGATGKRLLVHGGASGIGTTAIQLGRAFGARVFATAGGPARARACETLGAERGIDRHAEDFVTILQEQGGAHVILDMVGGPYLPRNLQSLADDGILVQIAFLQGPRVELDLGPLMRRRLTLTGSTLRPQSVEQKARIAREVEEHVWPLLARGEVRPLIHAEFPLEEAAAAHALLESNEVVGKIVLRIA
jgi:putative PIG3 family NAD(P)H quinone oxidoreductase